MSQNALIELSTLRFARDIEEHKIDIISDFGSMKHLHFQQPGSSFYWFDIVTWPGNLVIRGDMGSYMFSRQADMFEFFRGWAGINPGYWAEKVTAVDSISGVKEFSQDRLWEFVKEAFDEYVHTRHVEDPDALWAQMHEEILEPVYPESEAYTAMNEFHSPEAPNLFYDVWDHNLRDYTAQYLWCCHAIRWGVDQYDKEKGKSA